MTRHFYRDDTGEMVHESNAIDATDATMFEADRRAWEDES